MHEDEVVPPRRSGGRTWVVAGAVVGALAVAGAGLGVALSDAGASAPALHVLAGCGSAAPHLTVQGTGQGSGTPDLLTAVFSFSTTAGSSASSLSQNNDKVSQALAALETNGVAARDVQTTGLSLQPQYAYPHGVQTLTGYQVSNTVTATLRHADSAGAAVDAVVGASGDAAQIDSLSFSFANPSSVEDAARADAVRQAKSHAAAMAAAAGRSLGALCSLTDNTQPVSPLAYGDQRSAVSAGNAAAVPLEPGTQTQTDQVTLVYAVKRR
jgi:uncharacterized protein YggE